MKKLFLSAIFALVAVISLSQTTMIPGTKYPFYSDIITFTDGTDDKVAGLGGVWEIVPLNKNIFKNHPDLKIGTDFYSNQLISGNNIDIESISKKFKINIVSVEVYPVRYFNEVVWKEQLQYIIDAETDNNLSTNDSYFYRCITVKKNKFDEYLTIVAYGTKMAVCGRPDYSVN